MSITVPSPGGPLHVVDHPGNAPALVLMHGFPDDSRIYNRLVPLLAPQRVIAFDFLGYGRSARTETGTGSALDHNQDLAAVVDSLALDEFTLVGHDASTTSSCSTPTTGMLRCCDCPR